jgi:hypothetical protein
LLGNRTRADTSHQKNSTQPRQSRSHRKTPAQVEVYYEDVTVGFWRTIKFSGAMPAKRVNELLERVEKLQAAVKFAREEANGIEASEQKIGEKFFEYLLG